MQKRSWRQAQITSKAHESNYLQSARDSLISGRLRLDRLTGARTASAPTIVEMQQYLEQIQHSMLIYHLADSAQFVLVIEPDSTQIVPLDFNLDSLRSSISRLLKPFHYLQAENLLQTTYRADDAHYLYQSLLQPIELILELRENLLIVPDAAIQNLPFDLLNKKHHSQPYFLPTDPPEYVEGMMIQKYRFSYLPDLTIPDQANHSAVREILLVANPFDETVFIPEYSSRARFRAGGIFLPLPFTEVEAASIKNLYPQAQLIKRRQASDALIKEIAADYDILHFATHAFTDSLFEMFSGLVLNTGGDSLEDGFLMGYEIEQLQLNCELVTLSACETALGRQIDGE
ncbi:MAG: CHAT domain-containing protein, partial [Calditrichota bacterium]